MRNFLAVSLFFLLSAVSAKAEDFSVSSAWCHLIIGQGVSLEEAESLTTGWSRDPILRMFSVFRLRSSDDPQNAYSIRFNAPTSDGVFTAFDATSERVMVKSLLSLENFPNCVDGEDFDYLVDGRIENGKIAYYDPNLVVTDPNATAFVDGVLDRNFYSNQARDMYACNDSSDITNVRAGPSARDFDKVAELLNGQLVPVLERLVNPDGYDYFKIVYYTEMGNGRLIENIGYVYHEALSDTCDADVRVVSARNATWPQSVRWWGCEFEFQDEETMAQWDRVRSELRLFGMSEAAKGLCEEAGDYQVSIDRYLGYYEPDGREYFQIGLNDCAAQFSIKDNNDSETYTWGWKYDPECLEATARQNAPRASNSPSVGVGDLFSLVFGAGVHGLAAISGTTADEMLSNTRDDNPFCYTLDDEDARYACLGDPYATNNRDARDILLGNCYGLTNGANDSGLREVCVGVNTQACHSMNNTDHAFACTTCGGSRQWAAVYATGSILTCYP